MFKYDCAAHKMLIIKTYRVIAFLVFYYCQRAACSSFDCRFYVLQVAAGFSVGSPYQKNLLKFELNWSLGVFLISCTVDSLIEVYIKFVTL